MSWLIFFLLLVFNTCAFAGSHDRPSNLPCKHDDAKCLLDMSQWLFNTNVDGIPEEGIESMNPLKHEVIEGDLGYIKYKLTNVYIEGMKSCKMKVVKINSNFTAMHMEFLCPRAHLTSEYDVEGNLLNNPVKGNGSLSFTITNFYNTVDLDMTYYKLNNKMHHKYKTFEYNGDLMGDLNIEVKNLDGSKKQLSDTAQNILEFAKENAKLFVNMIGSPVHALNTKKMLKNLNKRLRLIPTLDLIQIDEKRVKIETV